MGDSIIETIRHLLIAHNIDPRIALAAAPVIGGLVLHKLGLHRFVYRHFQHHKHRRRRRVL